MEALGEKAGVVEGFVREFEAGGVVRRETGIAVKNESYTK